MGGRSVLSGVWQHVSASQIRDGRAGSSQSCQKTELTMLGQKSLNCRHSSRSLTCKALPKGSSIKEKINALLRPRWLYTPFTWNCPIQSIGNVLFTSCSLSLFLATLRRTWSQRSRKSKKKMIYRPAYPTPLVRHFSPNVLKWSKKLSPSMH